MRSFAEYFLNPCGIRVRTPESTSSSSMSAVFFRRTGWIAVAARNGGAGFGSPSLVRFRSKIAGGQSQEAAAIMAEIEEMIEKERASSLLNLMSDLSRNTKVGGSSRIGRMEADLEERVKMTLDLARRSAKTADDMEQLREAMDVKMRALNEMEVKTRVLNEKLRSKTEELESLRWSVMCALRTVAVVSAAGAGAMALMAAWEL